MRNHENLEEAIFLAEEVVEECDKQIKEHYDRTTNYSELFCSIAESKLKDVSDEGLKHITRELGESLRYGGTEFDDCLRDYIEKRLFTPPLQAAKNFSFYHEFLTASGENNYAETECRELAQSLLCSADQNVRAEMARQGFVRELANDPSHVVQQAIEEHSEQHRRAMFHSRDKGMDI